MTAAVGSTAGYYTRNQNRFKKQSYLGGRSCHTKHAPYCITCRKKITNCQRSLVRSCLKTNKHSYRVCVWKRDKVTLELSYRIVHPSVVLYGYQTRCLIINKEYTFQMRFEVLMPVKMSIVVFWVVTPCSLEEKRW
jgi:hypothetical protein